MTQPVAPIELTGTASRFTTPTRAPDAALIARLEGIIADRRELYNDSVYLYNTRIAQVPAVLVAWLFAWKPRPLFTAEPGDTVRPDVDLRFH